MIYGDVPSRLALPSKSVAFLGVTRIDPIVFQERYANQARLMYYFNCNLTINIYHTVSCF